MSAGLDAPVGAAELPSGEEERFLRDIARMLERLHSACDLHGYPLLAALLDMARCEALGDLTTRVEVTRLSTGEVRLRKRKPAAEKENRSAAGTAERPASPEPRTARLEDDQFVF